MWIFRFLGADKMITAKYKKKQVALLLNYSNYIDYFISKESRFEKICCIDSDKNKIEQDRLRYTTNK